MTFSGIELAYRICKCQFNVAYKHQGQALSLKELWDQALSDKSISSDSLDHSPPPLMHQISRSPPPRLRGPQGRDGVVRYPRRVSLGQCLYLMVMAKGGRYWHYRYRFEGREKLLSLGCPPDVPVESAWRDVMRRGGSLKRALILPAKERRCVESPSMASNQIGRKPS